MILPTGSSAPASVKDVTAYRVQLAAELLRDIEGHLLSAEQLLFKARRLANIAGDKEVEECISCELGGYPRVIPRAVERWVDATGRRARIVQRAVAPAQTGARLVRLRRATP